MLGAKSLGTSRHGHAGETARRYKTPGQKLSDQGRCVERTPVIETASSAWKVFDAVLEACAV